MKLDRYDLAILLELQQNGRISKRDLADKIGLSVSPCWVRMRRLEDLGYLSGYTANVDLRLIAKFCYVTTLVSLKTHEANDFTKFENAVSDVPQIVHCEAVIGEIDYILKFIALDVDHYQRLIDKILDANIGIHKYSSNVRSKLIKSDSTSLLAELFQNWPLRHDE